MDPVVEARFWALAATPSEIAGYNELRVAFWRWQRDHQGVLSGDAAAFLMCNIATMYLLPLQGAPFLGQVSAADEQVADLVRTLDVSTDALSTETPSADLVDRLLADLTLVLSHATEVRDSQDEPVSARQLLGIIDGSWSALRARFS